MTTRRPIAGVLAGGGIAATLDIGYAIVRNGGHGRTPLRVLRSRAALCGLVFGVLVYLFMNLVVLPLSAFPFHLTYPPLRLLEGFASHAVFVGLPIALAVRHFDRQG